jgi:hypothetical protein
MFAVGLSTSILTLLEPSGLHKDYVFSIFSFIFVWGNVK